MTDRVREALFSILGERVEGSRVLDLYAGGGSLSCEALSRGATSALLVDRSADALEAAAANLEACGFGDRARLVRSDVRAFLRSEGPGPSGFDLVFVDPPYSAPAAEVEDLLRVVVTSVAPCGLVVVHRPNRTTPGRSGERVAERDRMRWPAGYRSVTDREYGGSAIHIASTVVDGDFPDPPSGR